MILETDRLDFVGGQEFVASSASDLEFLNAYLLNEQRKRVTLRAKHRKIDTYYPDEGPLRRELYPVHMQFFAAGGKHEPSPACPAGCDGSPHTERCFLAANRVGKCSSRNSIISTPDGPVSIDKLIELNKPFNVFSLDLNTKQKTVCSASVPFKKPGLHKCYRITMADGQWFECADDHRLLSSSCSSWPLFSELLTGFSPSLLGSSLGHDRPTHVLSAQRLTRTAEDSPENYQGVSASTSPFILASNNIVSVDFIGVKEAYDFTVEKTHNYIAADLVHHNTEGVGAYEMALHLTGGYPDWWPGRRFTNATRCWAAGDTSKTVHVEILQPKLLGMPGSFGTGMIPGDRIKDMTRKVGMPDAIETIYVYHSRLENKTSFPKGKKSHEISVLTLKSYEQGRESFQGTEKDVIWLDEECDREIYTECLLRLLAVVPGKPNGLMILTFTPLEGMTDIVRDFLGMNESTTPGAPGSPEMENFGTPKGETYEPRKDHSKHV